MDSLSWDDRLNRCYFLAVAAIVERTLIEHVLIHSLERFIEAGEEYPFVKPAELKPGGISPTLEHSLHNTALVLLLEQEFPDNLKTFIRVRKKNSLLAKNLSYFTLPDAENIEGIGGFREIISMKTMEAIKPLLSLDMGLLAQRKKKKGGYGIEFSNFHVRIDAVLDSIIEDFGVDLKYLSKHLFEQGEEYADLLEAKFYESFGMKVNASGRRTAAIVGHRLLSQYLDSLHTVYCGSTEARCLYKIHCDDTLTRIVLIQISDSDIEELTATFNLTVPELEAHYLLPAEKVEESGTTGKAALFLVRNNRQPAALQPVDRKPRREISAMERWISIDLQCILPLPNSTERPPLQWNWVYRTTGRTNDGAPE
jgi:hypothetical protein